MKENLEREVKLLKKRIEALEDYILEKEQKEIKGGN
jgi:hypothetical protein